MLQPCEDPDQDILMASLNVAAVDLRRISLSTMRRSGSLMRLSWLEASSKQR